MPAPPPGHSPPARNDAARARLAARNEVIRRRLLGETDDIDLSDFDDVEGDAPVDDEPGAATADFGDDDENEDVEGDALDDQAADDASAVGCAWRSCRFMSDTDHEVRSQQA